MKLDAERLKEDLKAYYVMSEHLGLPVKRTDRGELNFDDEAELITAAADEGWDLGKYITEY